MYDVVIGCACHPTGELAQGCFLDGESAIFSQAYTDVGTCGIVCERGVKSIASQSSAPVLLISQRNHIIETAAQSKVRLRL